MRAEITRASTEHLVSVAPQGRDVSAPGTSVLSGAAKGKTAAVLLASDGLSFAVALAVAVLFVPVGSAVWAREVAGSLMWSLAILPLAFSLAGLYPSAGVGPVEEMRRLLTINTAFGAWLVLLLILLLGSDARTAVLGASIFWVVSCAALPINRGLVRHLFGRESWWGQSAIVLGAGKTSELLISGLRSGRQGMDLRILCCLDDDPEKIEATHLGVPVVGPISSAPALKQELGVDYAIIAMPGLPPDRLSTMAYWAGTLFKNVVVIPNAFGLTSIGTSTRDAGGVVGIHLRGHLSQRRNRVAKRVFDVLAVIPIGILALPIVLIGALAVFIASPGNPFYSQVREGYQGRSIRIWKIRSMKPDGDAILSAYLAERPEARSEWETHFKLARDPRIIPVVGALIRRTSIDELPQLLNVLLGQMSLVGPRPFPYYHLDNFDDSFRELRASVRPGITGYWQVTSRGTADLLAQVELDSFYVRNWSLWLDLYIIARTPWAVAFGSGIY